MPDELLCEDCTHMVIHAAMVDKLLLSKSMLFGRLLSLCVQLVELAFIMYEQYYAYAGLLLAITIAAGFASSYELYRKRVQLYNAVAQRHLIPIVQAGHVRYVGSPSHGTSACCSDVGMISGLQGKGQPSSAEQLLIAT